MRAPHGHTRIPASFGAGSHATRISVSSGISAAGPAGSTLQGELQKVAELLADQFPNAIAVRCDSKSGGAFLVGAHGDIFNAQDQAGVCVGLREGAFSYSVLVMRGALKRIEDANSGLDGRELGLFPAADIADALRIVSEKAAVPTFRKLPVPAPDRGIAEGIGRV